MSGRIRIRGRAAVVAAAAVCVAPACAAGPAAADVHVSSAGGTITATTDPGTPGYTLFADPKPPSDPLGNVWLIGATGANVTATAPCEAVGGSGGLTAAARCPRDGVSRLDLALGDGADTAQIHADIGVHLATGAGNDTVQLVSTAGDVAVELGDGDDDAQLSDDAGDITADGGAGNDSIDARASAPHGATVLGGDGNDDLVLRGGPGRIDGGPGDDQIDAGPADGDRDAIACGPGQDVTGNPFLWTEDQIADDCPPDSVVALAAKGSVRLAGAASAATIGFAAVHAVQLVEARIVRSVGLRNTTLARLGSRQLAAGAGVLKFKLNATGRRVLARKKATNLRVVGTLRGAGGDTLALAPQEALLPFAIKKRGR
jgi:hypothetical protein